MKSPARNTSPRVKRGVPNGIPEVPGVAGSVAHQSFRGGIGTSISTKLGIGDVVRTQLESFTHREVRGDWFARSVQFSSERSVNLSVHRKKQSY